LGWSRPTINIFLKTKSLWIKDDAVCLMGSGGCHLLWTVKTWWTVNAHRYHQQLIKLCVKNSAWKKAALSKKTRLTWFSFTTTHHGTHQQWFKTWRHSTGKCYPIPLTYQTWHLLTITFHRWATRFTERHFDSYEDVRKWLDEWFASKDEEFFWRGIHKLPERWEICIVSEGKYFE